MLINLNVNPAQLLDADEWATIYFVLNLIEIHHLRMHFREVGRVACSRNSVKTFGYKRIVHMALLIFNTNDPIGGSSVLIWAMVQYPQNNGSIFH